MTDKEEKKDKIEQKKEEKKENHESTLKNVLIIGGVMILLIIGLYFYTQAQNTYSYKEIDFKKTKIGEITFYETTTFAQGENGNFGFRIRTNPNELKKIPFRDVENLRLMKLNAIASEGNSTFKCGGEGVIAIANLQILFSNMGTELKKYENSTCDPEGRYNYFTLKYGNETSINEIGNACYDIIVQGDEESCEILPATEKLMVELYSRYLNLER